jgi:hypothetical protein
LWIAGDSGPNVLRVTVPKDSDNVENGKSITFGLVTGIGGGGSEIDGDADIVPGNAVNTGSDEPSRVTRNILFPKNRRAKSSQPEFSRHNSVYSRTHQLDSSIVKGMIAPDASVFITISS